MRSRILSVLLGSVVVLGCGGGGDGGMPLISGSVEGVYKGEAFTPTSGFAQDIVNGSALIGLSEGGLGCGEQEAPDGITALISLSEFEPGEHEDVYVDLFRRGDDEGGATSDNATVTLTSVTVDAVAGTIDWDETDDAGLTFGLHGTFEVTLCGG